MTGEFYAALKIAATVFAFLIGLGIIVMSQKVH